MRILSKLISEQNMQMKYANLFLNQIQLCDQLFKSSWWDGSNKSHNIDRAPDKVHICISILSISSPIPMFDHLLESSRRDDSNKL